MIRIAAGALLAGALVAGCRSSTPPRISTVCPSSPDEFRDAMTTVAASGGTVAFSGPPRVYAVAHGAKTEMREGESEWCGTVSDVFNVVTSDEPLTVRPGEEIVIPNPLPGEQIHDAGIMVHRHEWGGGDAVRRSARLAVRAISSARRRTDRREGRHVRCQGRTWQIRTQPLAQLRPSEGHFRDAAPRGVLRAAGRRRGSRR